MIQNHAVISIINLLLHRFNLQRLRQELMMVIETRVKIHETKTIRRHVLIDNALICELVSEILNHEKISTVQEKINNFLEKI